MSKSPSRRQGHQPAGARARQVPAEAHEGRPLDFLRRHEPEAREAIRNSASWRQLLPRLLNRIADPRNMKLAVDHVAAKGDRWLQSLDQDERWELTRVLNRAILNGSYRRGRERTRKEPKSSGKGFRTITKPDAVDRVVERAVVQILQPLLDPLFLDTSLGYRPGKGRNDALALAEQLARKRNQWVWIAEDYKDAFDNVPQRRLLDVIRHYLPEDKIVRLIELLVVSKTGKGLRQGGPSSPLLLNLYLHHLLDQPWRSQFPDVSLIRVADDLLVICNSEQDAATRYSTLSQLALDSGMVLKGTPLSTIRDLSAGNTVDWLGYGLQMNGDQLQVYLTDRTWQTLEKRLISCHEKPDPPLRAVEVIRGWVAQLGPTYLTTDHCQVYAKAKRIAATHGFEEIPLHEEFLEQWVSSHKRWEQKRRHVSADAATRLSRGSARAEVSRADSGLLPGETPERGVSPGTSSSTYTLTAAGHCRIDGERGAWSYFLIDESGSAVSSRHGSSPHTTRERMELIAVLRGLEAAPSGSRLHLIVPDDTAIGIAGLCCRIGEGISACDRAGRVADLWHRLAAKLAAYEVSVERRSDPSPEGTVAECRVAMTGLTINNDSEELPTSPGE